MKILAISNKKAVAHKPAVENHAPAHKPFAPKAVAHDTFHKSNKK